MAKGNWSIYKSTKQTKYKRCFQKGIYDAKTGNIFGTFYPIHVEDYPAKRGYIDGFKEKTVKFKSDHTYLAVGRSPLWNHLSLDTHSSPPGG